MNQAGETQSVNQVCSNLAAVRERKRVSVADLARRTGVSRQAVYAIEKGEYVPNTEISLKMARVLGVAVEDLFTLSSGQESEAVKQVALIPAVSRPVPTPVRVCRVGRRWVGVQAFSEPCLLPDGDAIRDEHSSGRGTWKCSMLEAEGGLGDRLLVAGCDPALSLLSGVLRRDHGIELVHAPASSAQALQWLAAGKVHVAGCHLQESGNPEFNLPVLKRRFPSRHFRVATFAEWEQGFVVTSGNRKRVRQAEDLRDGRVRIVNREKGSGSRALLDALLASAGLSSDSIQGYRNVATGHLSAAFRVSVGSADCCVATRSAARAYGLDFIPIRTERFDLVFHTRARRLPAIEAMLEALQSRVLHRKLGRIAGYEARHTGRLVL